MGQKLNQWSVFDRFVGGGASGQSGGGSIRLVGGDEEVLVAFSAVFRVPPVEVGLEVVDEKPLGPNGQPSSGVADLDANVIRLFSGVRGARRMNVIAHEVGHFWDYYYPADGGPEAGASQKALAMQLFLEDVMRLGGPEALDALVSVEEAAERVAALQLEEKAAGGGWVMREVVVMPVDDPADPGEEGSERAAAQRFGTGLLGSADCCGVGCGRRFLAARVQTSEPRYVDRLEDPWPDRIVGGEVVERRLFCPDCGHVQTWLEGWDAVRRVPNGVAVCWPQTTTDPEAVAAFLEAWPAALGDVAV